MRGDLRVVVAADESPAREALIAALKEICGAQVWAAAEGDTVVALAEQQMPDLIILDSSAWGIDALALCRAIAERSSLIMTKLWVIAGGAEEEPGRPSLACYADRWIPGPVSPRELSTDICVAMGPGPRRLEWMGQ